VGRILLIDLGACNPFTKIFFKFYPKPTVVN